MHGGTAARAASLTPGLTYDKFERVHTGIGTTLISRLSPAS